MSSWRSALTAAAVPAGSAPAMASCDRRLVERLLRRQAERPGERHQRGRADAGRRAVSGAERHARRVEGDAFPMREDQDPARRGEDPRRMLRGEDRAPVADDLAQEVRDGFGPQRVELRRRLVDDEDGRVHRHDAGDRHPLLLAAGERERLPIGEVRDAQPFEHGIDPAVHLVARDGEVLEAEGELLADRGLRGGQLVGRRREHDADLAQPIRRAGAPARRCRRHAASRRPWHARPAG